jgi:alkyldihydroxyacetonephosphate synthase
MRSWHSWGTTDAAVSGEELDGLLNRVAGLVPGAELVDHPPPKVSELGLPEPRIAAPGPLSHLCSAEPTDRASHARGKSFRDVVRNLHGELDHVPDLVARPRSEQDVVDLLDWCTRAGIAAIPYGGGSSVVGGVEPRCPDHPGAVTLDMAHLDQVLEVDETSLAARIQAGTHGPHLEDQLRPRGLTLRHFPQSFEFSTLGGWLATRSGGHYATLLTHIDDMVESMRVVAPSGTGESFRLPGSGAGPSPDRFLLGSEGALGVITEAWMRVRRRPQWRAGASVTFGDFPSAVAATREIAQSGLHPANCRLLDPNEAFLNAGTDTAGGVLVLGFESADHPVDDALARALEICRGRGGEPAEPSGGSGADQKWRSAFVRMPYHRDALARHAMIMETFETACTWDRFEALHAAVTEAANKAIREITGTGLVTCRFTHVYPDGPAPYYGIYAPGRWGSTVAQWDTVKEAVSEVLTEHGATITHHHAVGRDHRPWYDRQRPDPFAAALAAAKGALDPSGILNPGVLVG